MSEHQPDTPVGAVEALWRRLADRDLDRAYDVLSASDKAAVSREAWRQAAPDSPDFDLLKRVQEPSFLLEGEEQDDRAVVAARFTVSHPVDPNQLNQFEFRYRMVREQDGWHVDLGLDRGGRRPPGERQPPAV